MPAVPPGQIFKATYSGVPVYECIIKDVAVMRRRSDAWLNATQILKVAGLDKSQRTRVLEKEVQKGVHEKVQGGYGKYQGTWIPMDIAIALAEHYRIRDVMQPIIAFVPSDESPPPAPKHAIASSGRLKKGTLEGFDARGMRASSGDESSELMGGEDVANRSEGSMSPSPSEASSSSRTPSPIRPHPEYAEANGGMPAGMPHPMYGARPMGASPYAPYGMPAAGDAMGGYVEAPDPQALYAETILDYFISEATTIPGLLVSPPPDFDPNMSIDEDEHTALHWACAMGRIRVVKLLLSAGADVFRVNSNGQTALMRAAMFSNNYDLRKFPELFELLHRSILNIDRNDRTVFHHVIDLALSRGKPHAARYYLETMINRLAEYGEQLADILNFQDDEGESALTMAARARSKRLVKLLLEHGADPKIRNREGKNAEDYIVEDERFRASPSRSLGGPSAAVADAASGAPRTPSSVPHTSEAGQRAAGRSVALVSTLLHDLADSYDTELSVLEKKLAHAQSLLVQIQGEIADSNRIEASLRADSNDVNDAHERAAALMRAYVHERRQRTAQEVQREWEDTEQRVARARSALGLADGAWRAPGAPLPEGADVDDVTLRLLEAPRDSVREEHARAREALAPLLEREAALEQQYAEQVRDQGTGHTMATYRRLIAAGCGGIAPEEVDAVVGVLSDLLDNESSDALAQRMDSMRQNAGGADGAAPEPAPAAPGPAAAPPSLEPPAQLSTGASAAPAQEGSPMQQTP